MVVYRYLSEEELNLILKGQFKNIGGHCSSKDESYNTHHYRKGIKYMLFFKNVENIDRLKELRDISGKYYIAKFNIPLPLLLFRFGVGYYGSVSARGYDDIPHTAIEFAIESQKMKKEYFVGALKDTNEKITTKRINDYFKQLEKCK